VVVAVESSLVPMAAGELEIRVKQFKDLGYSCIGSSSRCMLCSDQIYLRVLFLFVWRVYEIRFI